MPFCKLSAGLGSTNKSVISVLFSFSPTLALSSPLCPLLRFSIHFIRLQLISAHSLLPGNNVAEVLARRVALLLSPAVPCSLSPLTSRIHCSLFSEWRLLSYLNSSTYRSSRFPQRSLCFLVTLAVYFLVFSATKTVLYLALISLKLAESRILHAAPTVIRSLSPLISFCTVQLRTLCAARSLATLCLSTTSGIDPGICSTSEDVLPPCFNPLEGVG